MIITSVHWFFATIIAVSVHLAGMLWLSLPPPAPTPEVSAPSEGIVVTLGRNAGASALDANLVEAEADRTVTAVEEVVPEPALPVPDVAAPTVSDADVPPEPSRVLLDLVADAAEVGAPDATPVVAETEAIDPETVESASREQVALLEPETVTARELTQVSPPDGATAGLSQPVVVSTVPGPVEPEIAAADVSASPVEVNEISPVAVRVTEVAGVEAQPAEATPGDALAENIAVPEVETVDAEQVERGTGSLVTASRQPATEVEQVAEPDLSEAARPVTIDLREIQDSPGDAGVTARYAGVIKGWLQKNMHYPRAARLEGQEGEVVVRFVIDREGNVQSIEIESRSGYPLLDREAREMIERGDPFPAIPEDMPGQSLEIRVPASFHVRDETLTKEIPPIILE